jgi:hypothetical protein
MQGFFGSNPTVSAENKAMPRLTRLKAISKHPMMFQAPYPSFLAQTCGLHATSADLRALGPKRDNGFVSYEQSYQPCIRKIPQSLAFSAQILIAKRNHVVLLESRAIILSFGRMPGPLTRIHPWSNTL